MIARLQHMPNASRFFLLSPASTAGERAKLLFNDNARFEAAVRIRAAGGSPVGEVFSFLSGLYFRGKLAYAERFAASRNAIAIITTDRGLLPVDSRVTLADLRAMAAGDIHESHEPYRVPLLRDARAIRKHIGDAEVVLLGSVATGKYVDILTDIFGKRLLFPADFVGRGDMSRGGLLLRAVRENRELGYAPVMGTIRNGKRPPRLEPVRAASAPRAVKPKNAAARRPLIPDGVNDAEIEVDRRTVKLTNLDKMFWPEDGYTKRDLLRYYAAIAPALVPHLRDRAMVMKRYPNGIKGKCFFMKRAPEPRPDWIETCTIDHQSGNVIDFPMIQDTASLLWIINLGCIDLNPWYARCGDTNRPDYLHFDLDPVVGATFATVREAALVVRDALLKLEMPVYAKTTGSSGIHVTVPIVHGPVQKEVWRFAKALAMALAAEHPKLLTAEYRIADRPKGRVLVDYNQNAWGRTLASIYSPRPKARATVSTPVTWDEIENGVDIEDFTIANVPARVAEQGDLWKPVLAPRGRFRLESLL